MTFKSLLLGSAAALLTVGGAEAADVSFPVAEPVTYVKVCDAFGTGYFYQPGTDTCIKIGGYVRFDVNIGDNVGSAPYYSNSYFNSAGATTYTSYYVGEGSSTIPVYVTSGGTTVGSWGSTTYYSTTFGSTTLYYDYMEVGNNDNHEFVTEAAINVTARTQTELGLLMSYIQFLGNTSNADANGGNKSINLDGAYLSLGPLLVGYTGSTFDPGGGYGIYGLDRSDSTVDQIRLSWIFGGVGIMVAAEDYQDRFTDGAMVPYDDYDETATGRLPDLVAALTATWGGVDAKVAFGWGERWNGWTGNYDTWGVNARAEINLDALAAGDRLKLIFGYAQDGGDWVGLRDDDAGDYISAGAFFKGVLSPTLWFDLGALWTQAPHNTLTEATGGLTYAPVPGFTAGAAVQWTRWETDGKDSTDSWVGKIRLQRDF